MHRIFEYDILSTSGRFKIWIDFVTVIINILHIFKTQLNMKSAKYNT